MKKSKISSMLLSLVIAFCLWLYVISFVSQGKDATFSNIPVIMEGETVLAENNLMVTSKSAQTVTLRLSGSRSDMNKLNSGNITVKVDLSTIREAGDRIALDYTVAYPADVPNSAIVVDHKEPNKIYVDVDIRRTKEIPVQLKYTGTKLENYLYDTENAVLDNATVTVMGPAEVADQIAAAVVEIDLTDRVGSISEAFRYTLVDEAGQPVNAESITTNVENVRVDMPIRKIKEVALKVDVIYGGGANSDNTTVTIAPEAIRVTGGEAVLNELGDSLTVGTINLAELDRNQNEQKFTITLPEGVTNQTGIGEATVTVEFQGLKTREFTVDNIQSVNVPEGLVADLISANLTVKVRGPVEQIDRLTAEDIIVTVDFTSAEVGTATYRASVTFPEAFPDVGVIKSVPVSATVQPEKS